MKVLGFAGFPMSETYTIIKAEVQRQISWYVTGTRRLLYIR